MCVVDCERVVLWIRVVHILLLTVSSYMLYSNNKIKELPEGVPGAGMTDLRMLHLSSNRLEKLPDSIKDGTSLEFLYLNSNLLREIPKGMTEALILLKRLTLAHNKITKLPDDFVERFGNECDLDPTCVVTLTGNPILNNKDTNSSSSPMEE